MDTIENVNSVRYITNLRTKGILDVLFQQLKIKVESKSPSNEIADLLHTIRLFSEDIDSTIQAGFRGYHNLLATLASNRDEIINEAADWAIYEYSKLPPGLCFPLSPSLMMPPGPAKFNFSQYVNVPPIQSAVFHGTRFEKLFKDLSNECALRENHVPETPSSQDRKYVDHCDCHVISSYASSLSHQLANVPFRFITSSVMKMRSQEDVGYLLWPAAIPFIRFCISHRAVFQEPSCRVLDIGSGVGLQALVSLLMHPSSSLVLSDFNPAVLHNLSFNSRLCSLLYNSSEGSSVLAKLLSTYIQNEELSTQNLESDAPSPPISGCKTLVLRVDWNQACYRRLQPSAEELQSLCIGSKQSNLPHQTGDFGGSNADVLAKSIDVKDSVVDSIPSDSSSIGEPRLEEMCRENTHGFEDINPVEKFSIITGSDMICSTFDAFGVASILATHLEKGGVALLALAPSHVRWGVEYLGVALDRLNLQQSLYPFDPVFTRPTNARISDGNRSDVSNQTCSQSMNLEEIDSSVDVLLPEGINEVVVAGGYETLLNLHVITWK